MPLFSIVTVTRNNLPGLRRTSVSVRAQDGGLYEWLVADGGSRDGTAKMLAAMGANFTSEPDDGIYDAMNKGAARASGTYLVFMNAGDIFAAPDTLRRIANALDGRPTLPDFIYGDALEERPGRPCVLKRARPTAQALSGMVTHHQAMFYRRAAVDGLRYDCTYAIAADYKFTLQVLARGASTLYCPFPLCVFESGGISQRRTAAGRAEQRTIRRELRLCSPFRNTAIAARQAAATALRRISPDLYWRLRRGDDGAFSDD